MREREREAASAFLFFDLKEEKYCVWRRCCCCVVLFQSRKDHFWVVSQILLIFFSFLSLKLCG